MPQTVRQEVTQSHAEDLRDLLHGMHPGQTVKFYFCAGNKKFLQIFCAEAGRKPP